MVAQLGNLTSDEIWHLVNYIRTDFRVNGPERQTA